MFVLVSNTALHDIDHGAANDCTDVISLIYTTLTLLQRCNFPPLVIMTFYNYNIPSFPSLYDVMLSLTVTFMLFYALPSLLQTLQAAPLSR